MGDNDQIEVGSPEYEEKMDQLMAARLHQQLDEDPFDDDLPSALKRSPERLTPEMIEDVFAVARRSTT